MNGVEREMDTDQTANVSSDCFADLAQMRPKAQQFNQK